jgi:hypothetical protein
MGYGFTVSRKKSALYQATFDLLKYLILKMLMKAIIASGMSIENPIASIINKREENRTEELITFSKH